MCVVIDGETDGEAEVLGKEEVEEEEEEEEAVSYTHLDVYKRQV